MSDDPRDVASEQTSSSDADSDEDAYESGDNHPYDSYSGSSPLYPYTQKTNQIVYEYQAGRKVARLREPRDLYGVSSSSFFQLPRWPYECQVLKEKIEHIEWDPPVPEPMYKPAGFEQEPACVDPIGSKVIYQISEGWKESYFMCSRVGGSRSPLKPVSPHSCEESDNTLVFESRFESGNLQKVVQVSDYDYQLTLRTDLYTERHTQWFYFRVQNTRAGVRYRFTIVNFMKPTSLYNHGMRPLMYSEADANTRHMGWRRVGSEIRYYKNGEGQDHYSLSWTFSFPHGSDTCYFAHCYPYTYSNLQDYLAGIATDPQRSRYCKIRVLCHSLAGNMVYVLTITNPSPTTKKKKKKAVILTARVHPGETNSSWMMKGFLDYILSTSTQAQLLRDCFIFKVVPMLNPDGVIVGNYRCSLTGRDLNRNYKSRLKDSFPSIWFTRNMIRRVMEEREILLYCDLHGHSRKQNVFMYGCKGRGLESDRDSRLCERIFPLLLSKVSPDKFSFSGCKFKVQRSKEGTGRVVMWKMGIQNSYTLEATFCGSSLGKRRGTHFSTKDLESLGYHFCDALIDYCDPDQTKYYSCVRELEEMVSRRVGGIPRLGVDGESLLDDVLSDLDSSTLGSDSSDSNGPPAHLMELAGQVKSRRKLLKSKRERNSRRRTPEMILIRDAQEEDEGAREKAKRAMAERRASAETTETPYKIVSDSGTEPKLWVWRENSDPQNSCAKEKSPPTNLSFTQKLHKASKKSRMTEQQRAPRFQDLSTKKVSVIYLMFNAEGEVITTKSDPCARNQDAIDISSTFNSFYWRRPLPLIRNLLSQRFPLNSILEPCCYVISPDISESIRPNTANQQCEEHRAVSFPAPICDQPSSLCSSKKFWSGEVFMEKKNKVSLLPVPTRAAESAPPAVSTDQTGKSKKMGAISSSPQNRGDCRGVIQKGENMEHLRPEREEILLPAVATSKEAPHKATDILCTTAATNIGPVQGIFPKMTPYPNPSHKSSISSNTSSPAKVRSHSTQGTGQKRRLGKGMGPHTHEDPVTTDPADLPANTWKDILIGLQTGEGGGSSESITLHRGIDHPLPTPPKGQVLKNGTSNGLVGPTRKPGKRVSLVPLPKSVPSSH